MKKTIIGDKGFYSADQVDRLFYNQNIRIRKLESKVTGFSNDETLEIYLRGLVDKPKRKEGLWIKEIAERLNKIGIELKYHQVDYRIKQGDIRTNDQGKVDYNSLINFILSNYKSLIEERVNHPDLSI